MLLGQHANILISTVVSQLMQVLISALCFDI